MLEAATGVPAFSVGKPNPARPVPPAWEILAPTNGLTRTFNEEKGQTSWRSQPF
jgi:hypothetical protein